MTPAFIILLCVALKVDSQPTQAGSVTFSCGGRQCPSGQDCLLVDGTSRCMDPCDHYTPLDNAWRATDIRRGPPFHCDRNTVGQGWYRLFLGSSSVQMPERCIDWLMCGTATPLWLQTPHPRVSAGIIEAQVCGSKNGNGNPQGGCCHFKEKPIHVKACPGNYYVYKFIRPSQCALAYCADVNTKIPVCDTCTEAQTCVRKGTVWRCEATNTPAPTPLSSPVRLDGSDSSCSGRVEVFHDGQWGTVCDDGWGLSDAEVVCRQVGCGRALSAPQGAQFGPGSGPIWLDEVDCAENESSLTDCAHPGLGRHNCGHDEDAGVICEESYPVRLVGSGNTCSGRVEVFHDGQWGTVCDDRWGLSDAEVVCRQVGCGRALGASGRARHGQGNGQIWLDDLQCSGTESSLTDCEHPGLGVHNCGHDQDAGVICEGSPVRLVGSSSTCSGRVEVFHDGQWGTVCGDSWDRSDAEVVCRQIGCGRALEAAGRAHFGPGSGPIWLDDVQCSGTESWLSDCAHPGLGKHDCGHFEDAGVICEELP